MFWPCLLVNEAFFDLRSGRDCFSPEDIEGIDAKNDNIWCHYLLMRLYYSINHPSSAPRLVQIWKGSFQKRSKLHEYSHHGVELGLVEKCPAVSTSTSVNSLCLFEIIINIFSYMAFFHDAKGPDEEQIHSVNIFKLCTSQPPFVRTFLLFWEINRVSRAVFTIFCERPSRHRCLQS